MTPDIEKAAEGTSKVVKAVGDLPIARGITIVLGVVVILVIGVVLYAVLQSNRLDHERMVQKDKDHKEQIQAANEHNKEVLKEILDDKQAFAEKLLEGQKELNHKHAEQITKLIEENRQQRQDFINALRELRRIEGQDNP